MFSFQAHMMRVIVNVCIYLLALPAVAAWTSHQLSRSNFIKAASIGSLVSFVQPSNAVVDLPNGVSYTVIKEGQGPMPERGELAAIRFAAYAGDVKIDDIFDSPEPYYTRIGSGGLLKGVEETLPLMHLGDRWKLTIPGNLAFGPKGRPASAGKPRIPSDATIIFEVEMVGLPGKEPELIELIGDV